MGSATSSCPLRAAPSMVPALWAAEAASSLAICTREDSSRSTLEASTVLARPVAVSSARWVLLSATSFTVLVISSEEAAVSSEVAERVSALRRRSTGCLSMPGDHSPRRASARAPVHLWR